MLAKIYSATVIGMNASLIEVEVDVSKSTVTGFDIVGLADNAIKESRQRVTSAIKNLNLKSPLGIQSKIVVNLVPANIKKAGSLFDLPISVGFLLSSEQMNMFDTENILFVGEVTLEGVLKPVNGVITITEMAEELGFREIIIPKTNEKEALLIKRNIKVVALETLKEVIDYLQGRLSYIEKKIDLDAILKQKNYENEIDFSDIKGQFAAKRALIISASGGHNLIMTGSPGSGKTLLAKTLANILPPLALSEALEITKIYSVAGLLNDRNNLINLRPFRSPHHGASSPALVGGGAIPKPGEISLAHRGVLFLDEIPEFHRDVLEGLRQPLEDGNVTIARAGESLTFPAQFILVAAMNPCPCGWFKDPRHACTCSANMILKYNKKISGPLLDRIDLQIQAESVDIDKAFEKSKFKENNNIRKVVIEAREIQYRRFKNHSRRILLNSEMNVNDIEKFCILTDEVKNYLKNAMDRMGLTMRTLHKIIKVSRTIADLDNKETIELKHINEALRYKTKIEEV